MKTCEIDMARLPYLRSFRIVAEEEMIPLVEEFLKAEGFEFEPEPFSPYCRRLLSEPKPLGASLAAFFGYIYIQDRSSMLPPLALNPAKGAAILDMCASPGSKSGFLAQLGGRESFVLANEPNLARLGTLRANMHQINMLNVGTCSYSGEQLPLKENSWPHILLDPPCSGWGTEDKNPSARKIWKGDNLGSLVKIQKKLLEAGSRFLAPGGFLLYSTCTTNPAENQEQAKFAEEYLGLTRVSLQPFPGFVFEETTSEGGDLLVHGRESSAQGFYLCLFRKEGAYVEPRMNPDFPGQKLSFDQLENPLFNPQSLSPGEVGLFGKHARFLPRQAGIINKDVRWQAPLLGSVTSGKDPHFILDPRIHSILDPDSKARIQIDDTGEIHKLLSGQSRTTDLKYPEASLWWRDLPLCSAPLKSGRIIPAFH